ncbi:MAG TPA: hypothetical protein VGA68_08150 [Woeseiaceae bacterium]
MSSDRGVAGTASGQGNEGAHCANVALTFPAAFRYVAEFRSGF